VSQGGGNGFGIGRGIVHITKEYESNSLHPSCNLKNETTFDNFPAYIIPKKISDQIREVTKDKVASMETRIEIKSYQKDFILYAEINSLLQLCQVIS
jgi:hypothetical protein